MQLKMESNDYKDVFEGFPDFHSFPCLDSTIGTNLPEAQREFNFLPKSSSTSAGKTDASHLPWCLSQEIGKYSGERRKNQRVKRTRSAEMHNFQERKRRERIRKKIKALHDLIPYSHKPDSASTLDDAIEYLKALQLQVQLMSNGGAMWQASCLPAAPYSSPFIPMNPAPRIGMGGNCDYGGTVSVLPNLQLRPSSPVPAQLPQQICPHPNLSLPFVPSHPFLGLASSPVMPPFDTRSSTDTHAISANQNTYLDWIYINN